MGLFSKPKENVVRPKRVTVDLSVERGYQIAVPDGFPVDIGKIHSVGRREQQEDAFGVSSVTFDELNDKGVFFVLADGMGGMADGANASTTAVINCLQKFDNYKGITDDEYHLWVSEMIGDTSDAVYNALGPAAGRGGCTLLLVRFLEGAIDWAAVGDSHIYLVRDYHMYQLNHDHIYANKLDVMAANGIITEQQALEDPMRKALTSFVGQKDVETIEVSDEPLYLEPGDWIFMMSDGIFGTLTESEMISCIDEASAGKTAMRMGMLVESKNLPNQDNYTGLFIYVR